MDVHAHEREKKAAAITSLIKARLLKCVCSDASGQAPLCEEMKRPDKYPASQIKSYDVLHGPVALEGERAG